MSSSKFLSAETYPPGGDAHLHPEASVLRERRDRRVRLQDLVESEVGRRDLALALDVEVRSLRGAS
jgi:hypothetical protein